MNDDFLPRGTTPIRLPKTITLEYNQYVELERLKIDFDEKVQTKFREWVSKDKAEFVRIYYEDHKADIDRLKSEHSADMYILKSKYNGLAEDYSFINGQNNDLINRIDNYNKLSWWDRIFNKV